MDDDDEYGTDADFLAALVASSEAAVTPASSARIQQPTPQRVEQPTPQRLDRAPPAPNTSGPKVVQPTPQAIASKSTGSSILVSTRQKGNPILTNLRSFAWEYSDILADYVLGLTTCALFLSLKYHRLHPEYIYNRIKGLQGKFNLRILLTMVDITNHEESLKELSKSSMINNVTVILCWSAAEAARYLELYKSFEHAKPSAIRGSESKGYAEKMVEFITIPRSINKTDAVSLVSAFGSIKNAVNARPEEIAIVGGWGEKKVRKWCTVVDEPFRARKAARRGLTRKETTQDGEADSSDVLNRAVGLDTIPARDRPLGRENDTPNDTVQGLQRPFELLDPADDDEEDALMSAAAEEEARLAKERKREISRKDNELSEGIAAVLANLRSG
ncbi:Restriction endonuclease-like protein [Glarea lozoyensis ATCC 20868]|uniref:Restriction endonuclease-like protein n=2 Tax=Glarea lozoyensis TaxID=101852 RepID=S3CRB8_GLAL2|nr:Restriction endonuclease-like protein [Glarea lozoyensis ATCC 20868]EHL03206.1 putative Mating-type switching protein swi10 [Glarea lozoyensis 74030]EPE29012.1 Restriction endonuclease-like protein [Glarea lozoyensis ATCC 20868]